MNPRTIRPDPWPPLPEEALRRRQLQQLAGYLRETVIPFSAYYREKFKRAGFDPAQLRTPDDLRRIPFTAKADFHSADAVKQFILTPDPKALARRPSTILKALLNGRAAVQAGFEREFRPLLMTSTTGRSADPVPFFYTAADIEVLRIAGATVMRVCGARREQRLMNLFPFAPHLAFWITHYAGKEFGVFVMDTGGGKTMGTEGNLRLLKKLRPDVLIGMPTFLYHLLTEAVAEGTELPNLCKLVLGGEKVPAGMRRKLRGLAEELGAGRPDVLCTYGFTEAKMAWAECPYPEGLESGGYHLRPELGIVEVVDPDTGEPRGPEEPGEIVFTPLAARGSVVIRYRTGDVTDGGITYAPCPHCKRRGPRLVGNIGRRSEVREMRLEKLKGTLVDFNALEHLLDDCEAVCTWQIELRKRYDDPLEVDELILHVQSARTVTDSSLSVYLDRLLAERLEIRANRVVFHSEAEMRELHGVGTQLKEARLVDRRPPAVPANGTQRNGRPRESGAGGMNGTPVAAATEGGRHD